VRKCESNRGVELAVALGESEREMMGISYKTPIPLLWAYDDAASGSFPQVDIPWFSFFLLAGAFFCCFTLLNGAIHRAGRC